MGMHSASALIPQSLTMHAQNQIQDFHSGIKLSLCLLRCVLWGFVEHRPRYFSLLKMLFFSADH